MSRQHRQQIESVRALGGQLGQHRPVLSLAHRTGPFRYDPLNWHLLPDGGT
jgi:hypothetical protein